MGTNRQLAACSFYHHCQTWGAVAIRTAAREASPDGMELPVSLSSAEMAPVPPLPVSIIRDWSQVYSRRPGPITLAQRMLGKWVLSTFGFYNGWLTAPWGGGPSKHRKGTQRANAWQMSAAVSELAIVRVPPAFFSYLEVHSAVASGNDFTALWAQGRELDSGRLSRRERTLGS